jgi:hypothetical protein
MRNLFIQHFGVFDMHENGGWSRRAVLAATGSMATVGCLDQQTTGRDTRTASAATDGGTPLSTSSPTSEGRDVETQPPGSTIHVADYGAPPDAGEDVTEAIRDAFAAANPAGATLVFEEGTYQVASPRQFYDTWFYHPLFEFVGYEDLTIEGNGATLEPANWSGTFVFNRCANVTLQNLTVDWERDLPMTEGHVVDETADYIDIEVRDNSPARADQPVASFYPWDESNGRFQRPIHSQSRGQFHTTVPETGIVRCPKDPENTAAELMVDGARLETGQAMIVRHLTHAGVAIHGAESSDLTIRNVAFHSNPGMGLHLTHTADVTVDTLAFEPAHGHWLGHIADSFHLKNAAGTYTLRNVTVRATGDDWIALPIYRFDVTAVNGKEVVAETGLQNKRDVVYHGYSDGDSVAIATGDAPLDPVVEATVTAVDMAMEERQGGRAAAGTLTLELDTAPPADLAERDAQLYHAGHLPEQVLVDGAAIGPIRGGTRLRSPNITIRNSTIEDAGSLWFHGLPRGVAPDNGVVENNTLRNLPLVHRGASIALADGSGFTITGNTVEHEFPEVSGISIGVDDVTITDNDFSALASGNPYEIHAPDCETVTIDGDSACDR